jgi:hypothetical protein
MPNNVLPEGDDQRWKKEVDRVLANLQAQIDKLQEQIRNQL